MLSRTRIKNFINLEVFSAALLILGVALALFVSNSHLYDEYQYLINLPISISIGNLSLSKTFLKWVNDGLMALFFLLLALETKFHFFEGEFSSKSTLALPIIAALGGAIVPTLIYYFFTQESSQYLKGWAIPIATDTAFVLGALSFFSRKIPLSARLFVVALSIIDDIIAVLVLAFFYTLSLNSTFILIAVICILLLAVLNLLRVSRLAPYLIIGAILWLALVEAGIHGTLGGIILGIFIPLHTKQESNKLHSPLKKLERFLHPFVALIILPLFAFLNSEISFEHLKSSDFLSPITMGIIVSLFLGKQLGIVSFSFIAIRLGLCKLPSHMSWRTYYGISVLCGIGFTFSLFIGLLSFDNFSHINQMKLGVMIGSILSAIMGIIILFLRKSSPNIHPSHN